MHAHAEACAQDHMERHGTARHGRARQGEASRRRFNLSNNKINIESHGGNAICAESFLVPLHARADSKSILV